MGHTPPISDAVTGPCLILREDLLQNPQVNLGASGKANLTVCVKGTGHTVSIASNVAGGPCVMSGRNSTVLKQEVTLALRNENQRVSFSRGSS